MQAEDSGESFYVKSLDILTANRQEKDIIIVDNHMANFTNRLTNGIWLPTYRIIDDSEDHTLKILIKYLLDFSNVESLPDVRVKIKTDFDLVGKFNN